MSTYKKRKPFKHSKAKSIKKVPTKRGRGPGKTRPFVAARVAKKKKRKKYIHNPADMRPMQVAALTGFDYQRARGMMLRGVFGDTQYDAETRTLTVKRATVLAWLDGKNHGKTAPKTAQNSGTAQGTATTN